MGSPTILSTDLMIKSSGIFTDNGDRVLSFFLSFKMAVTGVISNRHVAVRL